MGDCQKQQASQKRERDADDAENPYGAFGSQKVGDDRADDGCRECTGEDYGLIEGGSRAAIGDDAGSVQECLRPSTCCAEHEDEILRPQFHRWLPSLDCRHRIIQKKTSDAARIVLVFSPPKRLNRVDLPLLVGCRAGRSVDTAICRQKDDGLRSRWMAFEYDCGRIRIMENVELGVSRRSFLAAAGVGALGVAGLGLFGCAPQSTKAEGGTGDPGAVSSVPDETIDVEICILGAGPAGVTAAIQAAEQGAEVLVVDLNKAPTGNAHSVAACGTELQHALGNDETPEEFAKYLVHYEDNPAIDMNLTELVTKESSASIDWLAAHGVEFAGVATPDPELFEKPRLFTTIFGRDGQKAFVEPLSKAATDAGVQFKFETEALGLLQDSSGAVTGIEAQGSDGHKVTVNAKSVIVATGGFGMDDELLRRYAPKVPNCGVLEGPGMWTRGSGFAIRSGLKIGAEVVGGGGDLMYKNLEGANADHAGMALHVGIDGRRFCDESMNRLERAVKAADLGLTDIFIIYDSVLPATLYTGTSSSGGAATTSGSGAVDEALQAALDAGTVFKADTIEELARYMGMRATTLKDTVDTYNGYCQAGVDEAFGKPVEKTALVLDPDRKDPNGTEQIEKTIKLLNEVKTPPFYATKCFVNSYQLPFTSGGLRINERAEVLDTNGDPIPNLYSGGEASNGAVFGRACNISGMQMMNSFCFGRIAGESAAANV